MIFAYCSCATFIGCEVHELKLPDWMIAELKRGPFFVSVNFFGIAKRAAVDPPPEDCPKIVTLLGSAPQAPILSYTHLKAINRSICP